MRTAHVRVCVKSFKYTENCSRSRMYPLSIFICLTLTRKTHRSNCSSSWPAHTPRTSVKISIKFVDLMTQISSDSPTPRTSIIFSIPFLSHYSIKVPFHQIPISFSNSIKFSIRISFHQFPLLSQTLTFTPPLLILSLSLNSMNERPKRDAVTNREATDKLLALQKRRSSAQVQQDKESAASAAAAANGQKTTIEAQKKKRVAAFEDQLRREDQHREKTMSRPDLVSNRVCPLFSPYFSCCRKLSLPQLHSPN